MTDEDAEKLASMDLDGSVHSEDLGGKSDIRGVPNRDADRYAGLRFSCDQGTRDLPMEAVNDEYCDCRDGSDEPGTSACSGVAKDSGFYCANEGYRSMVIPTSRVNDGICDCCDGSDEPSGSCKDSCKEDGASYRVEMERLQKIIDAGKAKKAEYVAQAANVETTIGESQRQELEAKIEAKREEEVAAQELVDKLEAAEQQRQKLADAMLRTKRINSLHLSMLSRQQLEGVIVDAIVEGGKPMDLVNIVQKVLDDTFDGTAEIATDGSTSTVEVPTVEWVFSDTNNANDKYHDPYEELGDDDEDVDIEAEEEIKDQEVDLVAADAQALKDARRDLRSIEREVSALEDEKRELERKGARDYGTEKQWYALQDKCFKAQADKYTYEICMYGRAKQDSVNLGDWDGFVDNSNHKVFKFANGQRCWSGPHRSLTVHAKCGSEERILNVREPSTCEYVMTFATPAAC